MAQKSDLQKALDWTCGSGKADCSAIQPGKKCFEPNNIFIHASFAFNDYYQQHEGAYEACNFGGTEAMVNASIIEGQDALIASSEASNSNLQNALDLACSLVKEDCSTLQTGQ
ncbi:hypothetical protein V6N13_144783 [Hibiscus sabdariffa]|uniref:Uncharacterized protein n=2 Tax=Hibiscus sabdariffa TaxID=183260 RepID=A0ABR2FM03_9ROSI